MNAPIPIDILVVANNPVDSRLLEDSLCGTSNGPVTVRRASSIEEAVRLQGHRTSDVALVVWDGGADPATLMRTLRTVRPSLPVVVFGEEDTGEVALQWIRSGAQDFLVRRSSSGQTIMRALSIAVERHKSLQSLEALAWMDELTGLYNRRGGLAAGARLAQFARRRATGMWVVCADLEGLDRTQEAHGRGACDIALVETAAALRAAFRCSDVVGRLGGGEFVVLALDATTASRETLLDRVAQCTERRNADPQAAFPVMLAAGAARFEPQSADGLPELIVSARQEARAQHQGRRFLGSAAPADGRRIRR